MSTQDPLVGQVVGTYKVTGVLGKGGMGAVYKAEDMSLPRAVALKTLPHQVAQDRKALERFKEGARSAARLNHPNIVTVYGVGAHESIFFIAMEFVDGASLASFIKERGKLPLQRTLTIACQIADALAEAHGKGVVHRDVNPHNIMIDKQGNAKLGDFGLARVLHAASNLTAANTTVGTPLYMAPEQWETSKVDARADIYSLGATLFEMVAGQPPFQASSQIDLIRKVSAEPAPPLGTIDPSAPKLLADTVARMLEKNPMARFRTAAEARAELEKSRE